MLLLIVAALLRLAACHGHQGADVPLWLGPEGDRAHVANVVEY